MTKHPKQAKEIKLIYADYDGSGQCVRKYRDNSHDLTNGLSKIEYLECIISIVREHKYLAELCHMDCGPELYLVEHGMDIEDLTWDDVFGIYDEVLGTVEYLTLGDWHFSKDNVPHSWPLEEGLLKYQEWIATNNGYEVFECSLKLYDFFIAQHSDRAYRHKFKLPNGLLGSLSVNGEDYHIGRCDLDFFEIQRGYANSLTGLVNLDVCFYADEQLYNDETKEAWEQLANHHSLNTIHSPSNNLRDYFHYDLLDENYETEYITFKMPMYQVIRLLGYVPVLPFKDKPLNPAYYPSHFIVHQPETFPNCIDWSWMGKERDNNPNRTRENLQEGEE